MLEPTTYDGALPDVSGDLLLSSFARESAKTNLIEFPELGFTETRVGRETRPTDTEEFPSLTPALVKGKYSPRCETLNMYLLL